MLRESQVGLWQEMRVRNICRGFEVSEQTYSRWRREYGGLKVSLPKRLKELKGENTRVELGISLGAIDYG